MDAAGGRRTFDEEFLNLGGAWTTWHQKEYISVRVLRRDRHMLTSFKITQAVLLQKDPSNVEEARRVADRVKMEKNRI